MKKLMTVVKGMFSRGVDSIESTFAESALEGTAHDVRKSIKKAKEQLLELRTAAKMIQFQHDEATKELEKTKRLKGITKDKEVLVQLIMQEGERTGLVDTLKESLDRANVRVETAAREFAAYEQKMNKKLIELRSAGIQIKMAKLEIQMNKPIIMGDVKDNHKELVNRINAKAAAVTETKEASLDYKLEQLEYEEKYQAATKEAEELLK